MAIREESGGRDSVKVSIMGFAQPVFISATLQKYIEQESSILAPCYIHIFIY